MKTAEQREKERRYRESRKEVKREYDRKYNAENKDRISKRSRAWREANKERKAEADARWRAENAGRKKTANAAWYQNNKDRYRAIDLKRNYGMTIEEYDAMHARQKGLCAICGGVNASGKRLCVDHNHSTGKVRDLLCASCNLIVGHSRERPEVLRLAAEYVERHRESLTSLKR